MFDLSLGKMGSLVVNRIEGIPAAATKNPTGGTTLEFDLCLRSRVELASELLAHIVLHFLEDLVNMVLDIQQVSALCSSGLQNLGRGLGHW